MCFGSSIICTTDSKWACLAQKYNGLFDVFYSEEHILEDIRLNNLYLLYDYELNVRHV